MAKVFVSYSRKDIAFAKRLTTELQKSELDFWIDWEGIPPTVDWWREIEKGIEEADIFLFLISPDSVKSKVCGQEIDTAVKNGKRVIPIVVRDSTWDETPPQLRHLNYIFLREQDDFDVSVKKLITAIQTDYEWAATHRRLQVKALDWERNRKESGFLLRGADLLDAEQDLATNTSKDPNPTDLQREFVFESRKASDRQRRTTTSFSIGAALALAALAAFGFYQAKVAGDRATIARARELAANAIGVRDSDFQLALLLGIESYRELPTVQFESALLANAQTRPELQRFLSGNTDNITTVAFSPDGKTLASGSINGDVFIWNLATMALEGFQPANQTYPISEIAFSPDGRSLGISGGLDTFLWDISSGSQGDPHGLNPGFSAFSRDNRLWVAGGSEIIVLDRFAEKPSERILAPSGFNGKPAALSPDGKTIAYIDTSGNLILWDIQTETSRLQQQIDTEFSVASLTFSPDGELLVSGNVDGTISIWDTGTANSLSLLRTLSRHIASVNSVAFSLDGEMLASGSTDKTIVLWQRSRWEPIGQPLTGHRGPVNSVAFRPDGKMLASGSDDNNIILWDLDRKELLAGTLTGLSSQVDEITFSDDSQTIATNPDTDHVELWNVSTGQLLTDLQQPHEIKLEHIPANPDWTSIVPEGFSNLTALMDVASAFSQDGETLALGTCGKLDAVNGCAEGVIYLFETATGDQRGIQITGHETLIASLAFNSDSTILASGDTNGDIILWDMDTRQPIGLPFHGATGWIDHLTFSPNGKILASYIAQTDYEATPIATTFIVALWDLDPMSWIRQSCERAGRNFTRKEWTQYFPQEAYPATRAEATCPQWRLEPEEMLMVPVIR